jgi:hypothetical protein
MYKIRFGMKFFLSAALGAILFISACTPSDSGSGSPASDSSGSTEQPSKVVRRATGAPEPVTQQQTPQDAQRRNDNTFNASPDPITGETDYGLTSFRGACEQVVVTTDWTNRMDVALDGCVLTVDVSQYGTRTLWEVPLDQIDKTNMVPFLDDQYHPGFKIRTLGDKPVIRKSGAEEVAEAQFVFADKQNASRAIYSFLKMLDQCEGE